MSEVVTLTGPLHKFSIRARIDPPYWISASLLRMCPNMAATIQLYPILPSTPSSLNPLCLLLLFPFAWVNSGELNISQRASFLHWQLIYDGMIIIEDPIFNMMCDLITFHENTHTQLCWISVCYSSSYHHHKSQFTGSPDVTDRVTDIYTVCTESVCWL